MAKPITINGVEYALRSKAAAKAEAILNFYPVGNPLSSDDRVFIMALLELRSDETRWEKVGCGIRNIAPMYATAACNSRTFRLNRVDGSWTDFSYKKSLESESDARYVKRAARYEIREQTEAFKHANFNQECSLTHEKIGFDQCHVDHIPPQTFDVLFAEFLASESKNIKDIQAVGVGDRKIGTVFVDRSLAERWKRYHAKHSRLRVISAKANLTMVSKVKGNYD
jgi:hypothetical protein